jgi:hypothetical protein
MIQLLIIDEAYWLETIDAFRELVVEECIFHIQLMNEPIACRGEVKNIVNGYRLDGRGECMVEVDPRSLLEIANHPPGLMMLE